MQLSGITIQFDLSNNIKQMRRIVSKMLSNRINRDTIPANPSELGHIFTVSGQNVSQLYVLRILGQLSLYAYASKTKLYANAYGVA